MHWVLLAIGIVIEIFATASLKLSDGFTKIGFVGLALLGFGLILAGVIVLNALSSAASG